MISKGEGAHACSEWLHSEVELSTVVDSVVSWVRLHSSGESLLTAKCSLALCCTRKKHLTFSPLCTSTLWKQGATVNGLHSCSTFLPKQTKRSLTRPCLSPICMQGAGPAHQEQPAGRKKPDIWTGVARIKPTNVWLMDCPLIDSCPGLHWSYRSCARLHMETTSPDFSACGHIL